MFIPAIIVTWAIPVLGTQRTAVFEKIAPAVAVVAPTVWIGDGTSITRLEYTGILLIVVSVLVGALTHGRDRAGGQAEGAGARRGGSS